MTSTSLAVELKKWRLGARLTLLEAERQTNIHRNTLQRYEAREGGLPKAVNLLRLAKVLNLTPEEVLKLAQNDKSLRAKQKDQQV